MNFGGPLESNPTQQSISTSDARFLADFIHELNIARRSLTLYPPNHPQVTACSDRTLKKLEKLFLDRDLVTLGVSPSGLFFEHQWLDKANRDNTAFAAFLSGLGIASLSFKPGLIADELIRFCQLLRTDRHTIEGFGGFDQLLQQQQIYRILLVPIDYSAFQSTTEATGAQPTGDLWEDFLHGLLENVLDIGEAGLRLDPKTIAEILNNKLADDDTPNELPDGAVNSFVERLLDSSETRSQEAAGQQLGQLLVHLSPQLQDSFLTGTFNTLDNNPTGAGTVLEQFSPELLQKILDPQARQKLKISARLVELVGKLAINPSPGMEHSIKSDSEPLGKDMVRARLDTLFSEENIDQYMPSNYQTALKNIFAENASSSIPEEDREQLRESFERQSVELQCCNIIFELLSDSLEIEDEEAIQQNLVDLSRFFLDTGNFFALREIYRHWSAFIYSGQSNADIFSERVLANHTQQGFMLEVLDGIELWGEEQATPIRDYIATVGEAYTDLVIEQLGLAKQFSQRRYWMEVLEAIGADANQLLVQALNDERWYLIRNLLIVLGKNLEPATLKAVQKLADHPHPKVRQEVMRVLFHCNPATANRMLFKELASDDPEAQISAIQIADLSNDPEILNTLHQQLQAELNSDFELECKRQILATLALIGHRDSLLLLRRLLQKKGLLQSKRQKQFQRDIIQSLNNYPRVAAEKLLREIATGRQRQQAKLAGEILHQLTGENS